jgi:signal transduction histidine kinase
MIKKRFCTIHLILLLLFLLPLETFSRNQVKTIVVFFPLNANMPSYQNFLEGFRDALSVDSDEPYNFIIEYLDIQRSTDEEYVKHLVAMYNEKLKSIKIHLLITIPPFSYSLLKKYGLEVMQNTPTLKIELDPSIDYNTPGFTDKNTLEIVLKFRISETLKNAFGLFPDFKDVYIISGNSITDEYFAGLIHQGAADFKSTHHFIFISGIPFDSLVQLVIKIPKNSIVFIPIYLSDKKNNSFSTPEVISILSNFSNAPVFPIFDSFLKTKGGIGGYVFSYIYLGKEVGEIARQLFKGKQLQDIHVDEAIFYKYMYDWKQLKKWNLTGSKAIPANSIFYNKDPDLIYELRGYILLVLFLLVTETILIVYLIRLNKRQKLIATQKTETENLYHEVIREDRMSTMAELTASLSHELNQPLTAILYSAQAGKRFLDSDKLDPAQAREIFENIIEDDKRAAALIISVRSLMKLETREKEKVNLNSLIRNTINIFHSEAVKQNIQINQQQNNEPVFVFGDKIQLQQVILNFLSNAANAMKKTEKEFKILEIKLMQEMDFVTVSVRDSGPGIDPAIKDRLFRPFVTSRKRGFGIGLAVSRSIIEKHNGDIRAENIPAGGAEFSFKLAIVKGE